MTVTATQEPQINDMIGCMRKSNHAASAARLLVPFFDVVVVAERDVVVF